MTDSSRAWVTLLTRSSYLPGVITLAHSLSTHKTVYPLIVLITPSLPSSSLRALELESHHNPLLRIHPVEPLLPPPLPAEKPALNGVVPEEARTPPTASVASRFEDTWTKLRAFSLTHLSTAVFLDADITIYKNMDEAFDIPLPNDGGGGGDWIAANHACVCNLDHDSWAPRNWKRENCAYTPLSHPTALDNNAATQIPAGAKPPEHTYALLNSGFFLYRPSQNLWTSILSFFHSNGALLSTFQFPDQDFLAHFFAGRWKPLSWKYNALKTMENWHPGMWRDEEVMGLHYIVDKPWERRVAGDGVAGHLGRDGRTHGWWWGVWEEWRGRRLGEGDEELVGILEESVAAPLTEEGDRRQRDENKKMGLPVPVPK